MNIKQIVKQIVGILKQPLYLLKHNSIDKSSYIREISGITHCTIGKHCWINASVGLNHVIMGNYCSVASAVLIGGMEHSVNHISTSAKLSNHGYCNHITNIGNDVWIGSQVIIRQGVTIGTGAVVGANSFVNKDVPPFAIVAGSPAKVIKYRFDDKTISRIMASKYWELEPKKAKEIIEIIEKEIGI